MFSRDEKSQCASLRRRLSDMLDDGRLGVESLLLRHMAHCPHCRRHAGGVARVRLAMWLARTRTHSSDLLARANAGAVGVLSRRVRDLEAARKLREASPVNRLWPRAMRVLSPLSRAAACLAVLLLARIGLLSSMQETDRRGREAVRQYYARNLDSDIVDQIL